MRKLALLGLITVVAAILFTGVAHADDYAGGTPPKAGSVAPSTHVMGQQFINAPSTGQQGAQVLGIQFTRTQNGLATTGADIAELVSIALVAIAIGVVMVRRGRPGAGPRAA